MTRPCVSALNFICRCTRAYTCLITTPRRTQAWACGLPNFLEAFIAVPPAFTTKDNHALQQMYDVCHCTRHHAYFACSRSKGIDMSEVTSLADLYTEELKDLWSANDQMARTLKKITPKATHPQLKEMLTSSLKGISDHTNLLKALIANQGEKVSKEHCKGMEGLALEALKHTIEDAPPKGPLLDAVIISQYQRMTHYGITGFGTVSAFSKALSLEDDNTQLTAAVKDMYRSDALMTELAEAAVNEDAARQD